MINTSYLTDKFKGKYRLKVPINKATNDFSRKLNGTYEDIDMFIECQYGNKVFHFGGSILQAYVPSIGRGHNIIKAIKEQFHGDIIFDIEETDSEILFKFHYKDSDKIIPLLKPKTNGANISPFSSKNLPRNKDYKIPDENLIAYKKVINKLNKSDFFFINKVTNEYIRMLGENTIKEIKRMNIKALEYFYLIEKYNEYLKYLEKRIDEYEVSKNLSVMQK